MILYASGVEFSAAGFFPLEGTGRQAYSLNPAWRFYKGIPEGHPYDRGYDDSRWEAVSLPHGLEYLPVEASGCMNYQGVAWYRKHIAVPDSLQGKKLFLHFE